MKRTVLLFGAGGAIGRSLRDRFVRDGDKVVAVSRRPPPAAKSRNTRWVALDPLAPDRAAKALAAHAPYAAVCWAQGANINDSLYDVDPDAHLQLYRANVLYPIVTLKLLLQRRLLARPARLCVISSIWQNLARQRKLSYCVSKAALQGFVLSAAADLAADGHLINAVLPGALDTPMTRRNLGRAQIRRFESATRFERLPSVADVASAVGYLCSSANTGLTGQFIAVDLGFSRVRLL